MIPRRVAFLAVLVACLPYAGPAQAQGANGAASTMADTRARNAHGFAIVANPYTGNAAAIAEGADLFADKACSGCHGPAGGGGMCPPVVNDAWAYGSDDTTLFNLIKLGSVALQAKGYARGAAEKIAGDMPPFGGMLSDDETWKLIAWIRSKYAGDPAKRNW